MEESGRVVAVEDEALWVETIRQSTCGTCSAQKGCGQGLMNKMGDGKRNHIRVLLDGAESSRYQIGEQVTFTVHDNALLKAAALVYLLPLISMLAGMAIAAELWGSQGLAAIGALSGLAAGFAIVRLYAAMNASNPRLQPRLVRGAEKTTAIPLRLS